VKRTLYFAPLATWQLRQIDRRLVPKVWGTVDRLLEDPDAMIDQSNPNDPSVFGVSIAGDLTLWFEILDERHAIRMLNIHE
jgi:hypothetical protein